MKVVLALEGRTEERKVLTEVAELCHDIGWELQVLHVQTGEDESRSWIHQNEYPNLSSTLLSMSIVDAAEGSVLEAVRTFIESNGAQLLILVNKGRLKKGIEEKASLISGLLHDLSVSVLVLPEDANAYKLRRILLTTKTNKVHNAIPRAVNDLLVGWPYELTLLHISNTGVAYKSNLESDQHPGWLLEAFEEQAEGQLIEVLSEMINSDNLDVLAFEIDNGEHPLIDGEAFKSFYEACPCPLLFVPI